MDSESFLQILRQSIGAITHPRFFATERGYQGELLAQLRLRLTVPVLPAAAIVEQEHQKVFAHHGLNSRPDIIIHEPYDASRHSGYREGNYAVIELKRRASAKKARADFEDIQQMFNCLDYPLGVFLNIASRRTFIEEVPEEVRGRVVCFAVTLSACGTPTIIEAV